MKRNEQKTLERLIEIVEFDIIELFNEKGEPLPVEEISESAIRCIAAYDVTELPDGVRHTSITLHDRLDALEQIGNHEDVGAFCDCSHLEVSHEVEF